MDDVLKRVLEAEQRAQRLVDDALEQQKKMLERAREEAQENEQRFESRMHELRLDLENKSEAEAARTIAQMERRAEENRANLRASAAKFRDDALDAAISIILDPDRL
ncbi:MAG: hypothetical protein QNJ07_09645 [Woeseiaceae bacterium]|nr:hypothetical protein [Woeseiaceae bacterium]